MIKLATAYCTTRMGEHDDKWQVLTGDGEHTLLELLPAGLTPQEAMAYLHFARPYEADAHASGLEEGKALAEVTAETALEAKDMQIKFLESENLRLSATLDRLLSNEEID